MLEVLSDPTCNTTTHDVGYAQLAASIDLCFCAAVPVHTLCSNAADLLECQGQWMAARQLSQTWKGGRDCGRV